MPQRKWQPATLQELCSVYLGKNVIDCCYEQAENGITESSSYYIAAMWPKFSSTYKASELWVHFCRSFFEGFRIISKGLSQNELTQFKRFTLEVIMDLEIAQFMDGIDSRALLAVLNPLDAGRLKGLRILDFSDVPDEVSIDLNYFDLNAVTVLIYPKFCTFKDLKVIGKKCLNIEVLIVKSSPNLTGPGLRALSQCSKLRYVDISGCSKVTRKGINSFLESNINVNEFYGWIQSSEGFTIFTHPDKIVYSNIKRFAVGSNVLTALFADKLVEIFPNLISLQLSEGHIKDLRVLEKLDKLEALEFSENCNFKLDHLKTLVSSIGGRITSLKMPLTQRDTYLNRDDLHEILGNCPIIENLTFAYKPFRAKETCALPPLRALKR